MTTIVYVGEDKAIPVADSAMTILDVSIAHKIPHVRACGGHGRCTTCRVRIRDGIQNVSARTPREIEVASALRWDGFTRLACQTRISGDVSLERLIRSHADVSCLQVEEASVAPSQERTLAILFSDIRDFTPLVEAHLAFDVVHILNRFFKAVGDAILINNGVIYQYVGDQIVGLFGVGGDPPEKSCLDTIRAGLGMLAALDDLNAQLSAEFGTTLQIGVGAHFGPLIVGMMGHPDHRQFAVVGDAINIASRIQDANKTLGTRFLMSEVLFNQVPQAPVTVRKAQAVLKGRRSAFQLVEVIGFAAPDSVLLVQSTIGVLLQHQKRFTQDLYRRLFELAPAAEGLFRGDMDSQGQMLAHMMQFLVHAMSRPEIMALGLRDLGRRHEGYGVAAGYYPAFRQAFLESAREILDERHTAQVEKAWADTIDMIIESMRGPVVA
ncbi:adenylate/guanylate cyclase domain-containing protein [Variovorax ureilyticus]|uniref:Adenylate/guanylate cyclase domain-containing protein n=1 Tax=Variovorax ureilyticus TaxID=1836198 RepID=A0ABU8VBD1_9BURK